MTLRRVDPYPMRRPDLHCPTCATTLRVLDHYCDYSTTRGPMTAYDVVACDQCKQMSLRRSPAQPTRA